MAVVNSATVIFGAKLTVFQKNFEFKIASFIIRHIPNTSAITFPTTFLTYTMATEAWKQAQIAGNRLPTVQAETKENA